MMAAGRAAEAPLRVLAQTSEGAAPKEERRVMVRQVSKTVEKDKVPFIGVSTENVSATLAAQLGLPAGTGLVVKQVVAGSPAAAVCKPHDILTKFDDQLLVEARQLSVLLRTRKTGDEVTLTYLRGGKEATAKVKLGVQEVSKSTMSASSSESPGSLHLDLQGGGRSEVDRILALIDERKSSAAAGGSGPGPGVRVITMHTGNSTMLLSDDEGSMEITTKDGKKTLVAKDAKGAVVFDGPITTAEERKGLSAALAERLAKLEGMKDFEFKTGDDFKGSELKVAPPPGQKMSLPPASRAPARVGQPF